MKNKITSAARLFLGLMFVVFGLNGFLQFMPNPPSNPALGAFTGALFATGYFFPMLSLIKLTTGALLLSNKLVPLALTVLAPIVINIFLAHAFLDLAGIGLAVVLVVLVAGLAFAYRSSFAGVLTVNATPAQSTHTPVTEISGEQLVA